MRRQSQRKKKRERERAKRETASLFNAQLGVTTEDPDVVDDPNPVDRAGTSTMTGDAAAAANDPPAFSGIPPAEEIGFSGATDDGSDGSVNEVAPTAAGLMALDPEEIIVGSAAPDEEPPPSPPPK